MVSMLEKSHYLGRGKLSVEETDGLLRTLTEIKEEEGTEGVNRYIVKRMMDLEEKETGGDEFLFWNEANAIDSAQKINALNEKLCELYGESGKFAVEMCVKNGLPESDAEEDALLAAMGVYTEESRVLHEEYVKSVAELCIKKMRLGALVDKCDKRKTLMLETKMAWKIAKEFAGKYVVFKNSQLQDSIAHDAIVQDNAIVHASGKPLTTGALGFELGSFRVMVEMMRGGQQPAVKGLDDAMSLGNKWRDAVIKKCVKKVWAGTIVERRSVFEVLKSEIAENWKMEKEVKDRIFDYQRELAQGFFTKVVSQPRNVEVNKSGESEGSAVVEGDLTKAGGRYAAAGMFVGFAELAIVKAKRMCMMDKLKVD